MLVSSAGRQHRRCAGRVAPRPVRAPRFCDACGAALVASVEAAEYKQATVLFAEVVIRLGGYDPAPRDQLLLPQEGERVDDVLVGATAPPSIGSGDSVN
jgi:hypothetical protein